MDEVVGWPSGEAPGALTMRAIAARVFRAAASALLVVACAPTFPAASATGKSGEKIAADAEILASGSTTCDLLLALAPETRGCETVRAQAARWSLAASMLADYGTALRRLADAEDPDVSESVSALLERTSQSEWLTLSADQDEKLAMAASALTAAVSRQYRRQAIAHIVIEADAHVGYVAERILEHADVQVEQLDTALELLDGYLTKPLLGDRCAELPAGPAPLGASGAGGGAGAAMLPAQPEELCIPDGTSERLAYVQARAEASVRRARLLAMQNAVRAFRAAHAVLERHSERAGLEELAAYEDVLRAVQAVYQAVQTAPPSDAKPAPGG